MVFDESTHTAVEAAAAVGAELGQIVKSLVFVVRGEDGPEPILCLVAGPQPGRPGPAGRGHRRARRPAGDRARGQRADRLRHRRHPADRPRAGRSAVIMDPDLGRYQVVWAAAGLSTAVFPVPPATLRILANATVAPIAEDRPRSTAGADVAPADRRLTAAAAPHVSRRAAERDDHLPGRAARALALGRQRLRARRSSPCPRPAGRSSTSGRGSRPTRTPLCRAELRLEGPRGAWTVRFASLIHDDPRGAALGHARACWSSRYGFHTYALETRDRRRCAGTTARRRRSSPCSARRGSPTSSSSPRSRRSRSSRTGRSPGGSPTPTSSTAAELVGGRLVLTSFDGQVTALDPATGRPAG